MGLGLSQRDCDERLLKTNRVKVSAAEAIALAASPKLLIDAPGPGKVIEVLDAVIHNPAANDPTYTTQYTESSINLVIEYTGGQNISETIEGTSGAVVSATEKLQRVTFAVGATTVYPLVVNEGVQLLSPSGDFAAGTNPWYVYITYRILDLKEGSSVFVEK